MEESGVGQLLFVSVSGVESFVECTCFSTGICSNLPSLTNGTISYNGAGSTNNRPLDPVATYTCDTDYTLNGNTTRTCGSDGMWSGSAPVCQRKWNGYFVDECIYIIISLPGTCSNLPSLTNGMISYSGAGSTDNKHINTLAVYSCNPGYHFTEGSRLRICTSGGSRDGSPPMCQRKWNGMWTIFFLILPIFLYRYLL